MSRSVIEMRRTLFEFVQQACCDRRVLEALTDGGKFTMHEDAIWDFKAEVDLDPGTKRSDKDFLARCCEISKDIVAFHNTYGGYLIIGVADADRSLLGFSKPVDVDALTRRIKSDTGTDIAFTYTTVAFDKHPLGLIFVPRRLSPAPIEFRKQAKASSTGKIAYRTNDIYFRDGASSSPAENVDHLSFLFGPRTAIYTPPSTVENTSILDNNLRLQDPALIQFVGRSSDLEKLWRWLNDRFSPVKLVTGIGGVGKTRLVRTFAEQILDRSPLGFEKVIWLTAKKQHWRPMTGQVEPAAKHEQPQYDSLTSLLSNLLRELAISDSEIEEADEIDLLSELLVHALSVNPSFIVVDDLDTLSEEAQIDVFQRINSILHAAASPQGTSRAIVTARLRLGASKPQLLHVEGFNKEDFRRYVDLVTESHGITLDLHGKNRAKLFEKFYRVSKGSPLFAAEIVRLVARGDRSLDQNLERFKDVDGERVRQFSFQRELDSLTDSQLRVIYALSLLERASFAELAEVSESAPQLLSDDLQRLRDYHLVSCPDAPTEAGQSYEVEGGIKLMRELIGKKIVVGRKRIETKCKHLFDEAGRRQTDASRAISMVVALWDQNRDQDALSLALSAARERNFEHPDVQCILGRAYLRTEPPRPDKADATLRQAYQLRCMRHELFDLWIEAKRMLRDWRGAIDTANLAIARSPEPKYYVEQATAWFALAEEAQRAGQLTDAIVQYQRCGGLLAECIAEGKMKGLFADATELRRSAFVEAINLAKVVYRDPSSAIEVWDVCWRAFNAFVRLRSVIIDGVSNLLIWANHVTKFRDRVDESTVKKLEQGSYRLAKMNETLISRQWDDSVALQRIADGINTMERLVKLQVS